VKFGIFYELQLPRPWGDYSEYQLLQDALGQIELADRLGFDYAWCVEHHFLELEGEDADTYRLYAHQNEDIVRLTPAELKAKMAAKERG
jgi:alkanesulfonate monooxygenase SsuD/methylene tetrahydromethanopterin reductase-like flavin-dependent oxidoreductase (luciferase family)